MSIWELLVVQPIFNVLMLLFNFFNDFGIALIIFTIIVKFALWPLMKKQLQQTRLMRKIQPELAEIKKRCKGNRQMETLQMMDLYKRNNVKPFRSILVLLVQLPFFIAIFSIVRMVSEGGETVARFTYDFLQGLPRIAEAIGAEGGDFALNLFGFVDLRSTAFPGGGATLSAFVLLAMVLFAAFLQYKTAKHMLPTTGKSKTFKQIMAEAKEGKQADQSELNNVVGGQMTKIMPVMMFFIMMGLPGAVVLYFTTSNVMTFILQRRYLAKKFDTLDNVADKKVLKELRDVKEGEVISKTPKGKKPSEKTRGVKITRIKANEKSGKKRKK